MSDAPYNYRPEYAYAPGDRVGVQLADGTVRIEEAATDPVPSVLDRIGEIKALLNGGLGHEQTR